jgi:hypothetical protein
MIPAQALHTAAGPAQAVLTHRFSATPVPPGPAEAPSDRLRPRNPGLGPTAFSDCFLGSWNPGPEPGPTAAPANYDTVTA